MAVSKGLCVEYITELYDTQKAHSIFQKLLQLPFQAIEFNISGRKYQPTRKVIAFGDENLEYRFSGTCVTAIPWIPLIHEMKETVQARTGVEYNFVLVNFYHNGHSKIGAHRDNETVLDSSVPIATLSFGATRTMTFTRRKCMPTHIELHAGSLLLMKPPTNKLWSHAIPPQPDVQEPRVSLTFHRMLPVESPPPAKRARTESTEEIEEGPPESTPLHSRVKETLDAEKWLNSFAEELQQSATTHWHPLGSDVFIAVKTFKESLRVDIRKYVWKSEYVSYPTKEGVTLTSVQWYEFVCKIYDFNPKYEDTSFVVGNSILALTREGQLQLHPIHMENRLFKRNFIILTSDQVDELVKVIPEMTDELLQTVWMEHLPAQVLQLTPNSTQTNVTMEKYMECVKLHISDTLRRVHKCVGCLVNSFSQLDHPCLTMNCSDYLRVMGERALCLLDVCVVVQDLIQLGTFTRDFFNTITFEDYKRMLLEEELSL